MFHERKSFQEAWIYTFSSKFIIWLWIQITSMRTWRNGAWMTTSLSNPSAQHCSTEWVVIIFLYEKDNIVEFLSFLPVTLPTSDFIVLINAEHKILSLAAAPPSSSYLLFFNPFSVCHLCSSQFLTCVCVCLQVWGYRRGVVPEIDSPVLQSPVLGLGPNQEQAEERPTLQLFHTGRCAHTHTHSDRLTVAWKRNKDEISPTHNLSFKLCVCFCVRFPGGRE